MSMIDELIAAARWDKISSQLHRLTSNKYVFTIRLMTDMKETQKKKKNRKMVEIKEYEIYLCFTEILIHVDVVSLTFNFNALQIVLNSSCYKNVML